MPQARAWSQARIGGRRDDVRDAVKLVVTALEAGLSPGEIEIVERKGMGHPDTVCDAFAEALSLALCSYYRERFGFILHHNVDKALLVGGQASPRFGGGHVVAPMQLFLAGRATRAYRQEAVPIEALVEEVASHQWKRFHALDPARHVQLHCLIGPGSDELVALYERRLLTGRWLANDTSCGAGYAPLSALERLVLAVEGLISSPELRAAHPELGEDVKVMGVRVGDDAHLTVACAFVDRYVASAEDYVRGKSRLGDRLSALAQATSPLRTTVTLNAADDPAAGRFYLTVTGLSAEAGDDGQVGRGNRANGLITPHRPMTMEATAGKNPVSHVGKLYNLAAREMAEAIVQRLDEVAAARCFLVSRIGAPIDEPQLVEVQVQLQEDRWGRGLTKRIRPVVDEQLGRLDQWADRLLAGGYTVY